jgi:Kef-type K+ transport system membrane component KefB
MITSIADILLIISIMLFIIGFLGIIIQPIRRTLKKVNNKFRLRHLFIGSILCFTLGLGLAWEDVVRGFHEGLNESRQGVSNIEGTDIES